MNNGIYNAKAYHQAMKNTKYNDNGKAIISKDDDWVNESEWDDLYKQLKKEKGIK